MISLRRKGYRREPSEMTILNATMIGFLVGFIAGFFLALLIVGMFAK